MKSEVSVIMISMSRWDGDYSSAAISLAKELAKCTDLYYIDFPYTLKEVLRERKDERTKGRIKALWGGKDIYKKVEGYPEKFVAVTPKMVLPINWLSPGKVYDKLLLWNDEVIYECVKSIIEDKGIKNYVFFNSFNPFNGWKLPYQDRLVGRIYQTRDDISAAYYVSKHGPYLEKRQVQMADVVLATSSELTRKLSGYGKETTLFPNACDGDIFNIEHELPVPEDIKHISGPIILYMGNICHRMDYDLLHKMLLAHPDKTLVLVGPLNDKDLHPYDLSSYPNLVLTGKKNIRELPAYLAASKCAIIPFKLSKLTASIYPLKLNEYLAIGKPVISTAFSEDVLDFKDVVYIAGSHEDFLEKIDIALNEDDNILRDKRKALALSNTWQNRIEDFWQIIEDKLAQKKSIVYEQR